MLFVRRAFGHILEGCYPGVGGLNFRKKMMFCKGLPVCMHFYGRCTLLGFALHQSEYVVGKMDVSVQLVNLAYILR